jgi:biotin transporter BioY
MRLAIYIYKDLVKIPLEWMPANLQEFRLLLVGWVYGHVSGLLMQHLWSLA